MDVRAPVEYEQGHLPGALNRPLLNNEERALIGKTYKESGQDVAVALGYRLISGEVKESRLRQWLEALQDPQSVLYCFRGGKRSQITQGWLREAGLERPLIEGGYKAVRQFLMNEIAVFSQAHEFLVVAGPTGSGKTHFINAVAAEYPSLDLEALARHRGSAFGAGPVAQPTQINFENSLAKAVIRLEDKITSGCRPIVEDESRLIGKCCLPGEFFERLRASEVLWLEEPFEQRVRNIHADYISRSPIGQSLEGKASEQEALNTFAKYQGAVHAISRKLGGLRTQEVLADLAGSEVSFRKQGETESNLIWIAKLLEYYYDPLYLGSLNRRGVRVAFRGSPSACKDFLLQASR